MSAKDASPTIITSEFREDLLSFIYGIEQQLRWLRGVLGVSEHDRSVAKTSLARPEVQAELAALQAKWGGV